MGHHDHDDTKYRVDIGVHHHHHDHTTATARLHWRDADLVGVGEADIDSDEHYPKRVGEELAVARALTHLTRQLFVTTAGDIASVTGEEVTVW
jgi:hypothetical protein